MGALASVSDTMSEFAQPPPAAGGDVHEARYEALLRAALDLAGDHDLDQILLRMVHCAADVARARYAALG